MDAELMLCAVLRWERIKLYTDHDMPVADDERGQYREFLKRRARGEPIAYILGEREFFGRPFRVDSRVLIPRPETELIVELSVSWASEQPAGWQGLDLGTGSGCLAISIALESGAEFTAVDISSAALEVAAANAAALAATDRIRFQCADLFDGLGAEDRFDLIVSNPPYIERGDAALEPGVRDFEPAAALYELDDAEPFAQRIVAGARGRLKAGGRVFIELGEGQAAQVPDWMPRVWPGAIWRTHADLAGIERVLEVEAPSSS